MPSRTNRHFFVITICVLFSASVWVIQYNKINHFYESHTIKIEKIYTMNEEIKFEQDYLAINESAVGHSVCMNEVEIVDFDEYINRLELSIDNRKAIKPEKLALVSITLRNIDGDISNIFLPNFSLYGIDSNPQLDYELLSQINLNLDADSLYISLQQGTECNLTLPYMLFEQDFKESVWNNMGSYDFYFQITSFPTAKYIRNAE